MADARRLGGSWRVPDPEVCMALCPAELMMCLTALAGAGWMLLPTGPSTQGKVKVKIDADVEPARGLRLEYRYW